MPKFSVVLGLLISTLVLDFIVTKERHYQKCQELTQLQFNHRQEILGALVDPYDQSEESKKVGVILLNFDNQVLISEGCN